MTPEPLSAYHTTNGVPCRTSNNSKRSQIHEAKYHGSLVCDPTPAVKVLSLSRREQHDEEDRSEDEDASMNDKIQSDLKTRIDMSRPFLNPFSNLDQASADYL